MSELVEAALRLRLRPKRNPPPLPPLPVFHCGSELVDIADRNEFYDAMEGR